MFNNFKAQILVIFTTVYAKSSERERKKTNLLDESLWSVLS